MGEAWNRRHTCIRGSSPPVAEHSRRTGEALGGQPYEEAKGPWPYLAHSFFIWLCVDAVAIQRRVAYSFSGAYHPVRRHQHPGVGTHCERTAADTWMGGRRVCSRIRSTALASLTGSL